MLKRIFVALSLCLLTLAGPAKGQGACAPREQIIQELAVNFNERQVALGLAADGHVLELFAGPGKEWTLIATRPDGLSCIVVAGTHLSIIPVAPATKPPDPA